MLSSSATSVLPPKFPPTNSVSCAWADAATGVSSRIPLQTRTSRSDFTMASFYVRRGLGPV